VEKPVVREKNHFTDGTQPFYMTEKKRKREGKEEEEKRGEERLFINRGELQISSSSEVEATARHLEARLPSAEPVSADLFLEDWAVRPSHPSSHPLANSSMTWRRSKTNMYGRLTDDRSRLRISYLNKVVGPSATKLWTEVNNMLTFSFFRARRPRSHRGSNLHTWTALQGSHHPKIRAG